MQHPSRKKVIGYGFAFLGVALATIFRLALDPILGDLFPFATLFLAIVVVAGYGGRGPALLTTLLGAVATTHFLLPPRGSFLIHGAENQAGLVLYLAVGLGIAVLGGAFREARRQAEIVSDEAVRQREDLMTTLSGIGDAVIASDAEGRVTLINSIAETLTGWSRTEAIGQPLSSVLRTANQKKQSDVSDSALRVPEKDEIAGARHPTILIARDGSERTIEESDTPIRSGEGRFSGTVLIFRDLDERRRAERALVESEARKAAILETALDAIITIDHEGKVVEFNSAAESTFGYSRSDVIGREMCELIIPSSLREAHRSGMNRYLTTGEGAVLGKRIEIKATRADGTEFPVELAIARISTDGPPLFTAHVRDITSRVRVEDELRESEGRFRGLMEQAPFSIQVFDPSGKTLRVNRAWEELWGINLDMIPEYNILEDAQLDAKGILADIRRAFAGEAVSLPAIQYDPNLTTPELTHHGDPSRWVSTVVYPLKDATGRVREVVLVHEDVTERRRAEEAIRESEKRFRSLADAMPQMVWVTRPDRSVEYINRRWQDYTGQSVSECLGPSDWAAAIHPEDLGQVMEASRRSHATGLPFEAEYRLKDRNNVYRWHLGRSVPIFDEAGRLVRRFGAAIDIEDRKRVERDAHFLAQASATLAAIVDEASTLQKVAELAVPFFADWCSVDLVSEGGKIRRLAVAHVEPEKVELAHDLGRRYPPDPHSPNGVPAVIRTGESRFIAEISDDMIVAGARDQNHLEILRDLGLKSYLCVPLKGRGTTLGAISFVAAESGRKYGENDLRLAEDLASRAAIAIENARLYGELKETDRRKDEFLATLAHELRNPLAPIRNALHIMRRPDTDSEMEIERAMAERQVVHLARLIDDLMDVARISQGKIDLHREIVDLSTIVNQAVETARPQIDERRHRLTVSLPGESIRLDGDPTRLEQVLWNLLNNSAKYTEPGGEITLKVELDGGEVLLRVRDTGVGIKTQMLPKVFGMFVQVDDHKGHSQGGLGIGLSLVRTLVEMHGGSIVAHSKGPGLGSEFVIRLPILPRNKAESRVEVRAPLDRASDRPLARRILVVDDNVDAARSLARLLTRVYGQEVRVAHDGPTALDLAGEFSPEVILLDIGLPGMDGYEVARRLRNQQAFRRVLLVALTGWGQEDDLARSREAGFNHHLVKPANPDIIRDLLIHQDTFANGSSTTVDVSSQLDLPMT